MPSASRQLPEAARAMLNRPDLTDYAIAGLDPERRYNLAFVVAPVFETPNSVSFLLADSIDIRPISSRWRTRQASWGSR